MPASLPDQPAERGGREIWFSVAPAVLVLAITGILGVPAATVAIRCAERLLHGADSSGTPPTQALGVALQVIPSTLLSIAAIATLATALALPGAWALASGRRGRFGAGRILAAAMIATPLLLPNYLAYSGWGLLRGPNTRFGDWLATQDPAVTIVVGRLTAIGGMALWAWPLGAFALAGPLRAVVGPGGLTELARLDAPSALGRVRLLAPALARPILGAWLLIALVMLGSAIPLHVAQVPTYTIELWKLLQLAPDPTGVWLASLPLLALALAVGGVVGRRAAWGASPGPEQGEPGGHGGPDRSATIALATVWTVTVAVPVALFAWSLSSWSSIPMFWRISGEGVAQSMGFAAGAAACGAALTLATWACVELGGRRSRLVGMCTLVVFIAAGLFPGVLVGLAQSASWGAPPLDRVAGASVVVLTHLARFGFVAVMAGWWLARLRGPEHRWLVRIDCGRSLPGWWEASVRPFTVSVVGAAVCLGALSLHEIESTVFVLPPGVANLPQQLLDYLHYARDEQLSAASINLVGVGVFVALAGAGMLAWGLGRGQVSEPTGGAR